VRGAAPWVPVSSRKLSSKLLVYLCKGKTHAGYHHPRVHRMQAEELYDDKEQKDDTRQAVVQ